MSKLEATATVLPIEGFSLKAGDVYIIEKGKTKLVNRCMQERHMNYSVPDPVSPKDSITEPSRRYGISGKKLANLRGYHPPKTKEVPEYPKKLTQIQRSVLFGTDDAGNPATSELAKYNLPPGGCYGKAEAEINKGELPNSSISVARMINSSSFSDSLRHSAVRRVFKAWSECMSHQGYEYASPLDSVGDPKHYKGEPTKSEIKTALTDIACKRETNLIQIWSDVERKIQSGLIRRNKEKLDVLRSFQEKQIANSRRVIRERR
ncbi:hypothetical protein [Streptomyces sp. NPDC059743]|uniref:hypothetical protein n=1 Tax=Streptomyces sp. NPDC059743 TaxID=3346928 RepID=UPI00364A4133